MSQAFHELTIKKITRETPSAVSISFDIPESLKSTFSYKSGQYITVKKEVNGEEVRRSYSICSSPYFNEALTIAVKEVENGKMSPILNKEIKEGEVLTVSEPEGNFVLKPKTKYLSLFAGGSGITPIIGLLKQALHEGVKHIHMVYANTKEDEIIFNSELEQLQSQFSDKITIHHFLEENNGGIAAETGRISTEFLAKAKKVRAFRKAEHFICGPGPMMKFVEEQLLQLGIKSDAINLEYFEAPEEELEDTTSGEFSGDAKVKVILDGVTTELTVNEKENILGAMLSAGLDAPYSCQGGVCATCRALVSKGDVYLSQNLGITDGEIDQGYTLTCSSYPRSKEIEINFDEA
ncbi:ferredoxin--NADP reductase [Luteibaculum oceani]|uniref:Ferredoxin--NADP reductase n=1 Tax=Luteibaculum oceani TaxID=1294296 RepID=A0A5C6V849_9FLAO|nr:ferredoxin--NADP reductase [Luteibaculum oceani]TXC81502.1 ferredoxin--NADP reductase [Luteibaculum oceani]